MPLHRLSNRLDNLWFKQQTFRQQQRSKKINMRDKTHFLRLFWAYFLYSFYCFHERDVFNLFFHFHEYKSLLIRNDDRNHVKGNKNRPNIKQNVWGAIGMMRKILKRWEEKYIQNLIEEDPRSNIKTIFGDIHAMRSVHTVHVLQSIKKERESEIESCIEELKKRSSLLLRMKE